MIYLLLTSLPWAAIVAALLVRADRTEERHQRTIGELCQRVQAPDVAVAQHVMATEGEPAGLGYVPLDDDDALIADLQEQLHGS